MARFTQSLDVQVLAQRLAKMAIGESVALADLAALVGEKNIDDQKFRGRLASARRSVQQEHRIVTGVEDRTLTRLDASQITAEGARVVSRVRKASTRGLKKLACVDYSALSPAEQRKHDAAATHLGVLAEFSRPSAVKTIAAKVETQAAKIGFRETLEAFKTS